MIEEFPAEHELIGFFESEPELCDAGVPWIYNTLQFETVRNNILVRVTISPSYGALAVSLQMGDQELVLLEFGDVRGIRVLREREREMLVARFSSEDACDFILQLKPSTHALWGYGKS